MSDGTEKPVVRNEKGQIVKGSGWIPGSGRKPGQSPHKKILWDVKAVCEEFGYSPVEGLIHTAMTTENPTLKYKCDAELMKYLAPQLKSVEVRGDAQTTIQFAWVNDPNTVQTLNADGSEAIEHRPEITLEEGRMLDAVEAMLHPTPTSEG